MTDDDLFDGESRVCRKCVVEPVLAREIVDDGERDLCGFCGRRRQTVSLSELAMRVSPVYERDVEPADDDFEIDGDNAHPVQGGDPPEQILYELLGCDGPLAEALRVELKEQNWRSEAQGGASYYDTDQCGFTLAEPSSLEWDERWDGFVRTVAHEARFYNRDARRFLKDLFAPLLRGDYTSGTPPIVVAGVKESPLKEIVRARDGSLLSVRKAILANPERELASPPPRRRREGRLNAAGIGVFYGCTDVQTAVAEIRVPVGGAAVIGRFRFTRRVQLLDLRRVEEAAANVSHFDPDYVARIAYLAFVQRRHDMMTRPVLPHDQTLDYLPTQTIAEYLAAAKEPKIDGILLRSSMISPTSARDEFTSLNVVLFAHASIVEDDRKTPRRHVVDHSPSSPDDSDDMLNQEVIWTRALPENEVSKSAAKDAGDSVKPTLRLKRKKMAIVHVRGIALDIVERGVAVYEDRHATDQPF